MQSYLISLTASVLLMSGCSNPTSVSSSKLGHFSSEFALVELLANGRDANLTKEFSYVDGNGLAWTAPAGEIVDGASIPKVFWSIIGGPWEGKYRFASIVHDRYCRMHEGRHWQDVHRMFYEACLAGGTDERLAKIMYAAVYHFGPRWDDQVKNNEELGELIPAERTRIAVELERFQETAGTAPLGARTGTRTIVPPTQEQQAQLVLAPNASSVSTTRRMTSSVLTKWDRIRAFIRTHQQLSIQEVEEIR
jgi:hypothetical protein